MDEFEDMDTNPKFDKFLRDLRPPENSTWPDILKRIDDLWIPGDAPHHSIISQTRGGKSYLARYGIIEPLCSDDKVLIIDVKGDDPTLADFGHKVKSIPRWHPRNMMDDGSPGKKWYRLVVDEDWDRARIQVRDALRFVFKDKDWIVYVDEIRALTDPRPPGLRLGPEMEQLWLRGGSKGICVVAGTQAPKWVPNSFYTQAQFFWIGRIEDEDSQKRLREIGSMDRSLLPWITGLKRHHFMQVDGLEDTRHIAIGKVGT